MDDTTVVGTARRTLGKTGGFVPASFTEPPSIDGQREAVRRIERPATKRPGPMSRSAARTCSPRWRCCSAATEGLTFGDRDREYLGPDSADR